MIDQIIALALNLMSDHPYAALIAVFLMIIIWMPKTTAFKTNSYKRR